MILNSFDALYAFAAQLQRQIKDDAFQTKVVVTPSSISEKGLVIKVSLLKTYLQGEPKAIKTSRMLRIRVSVTGAAASRTGLEQALSAIEAMDAFLASDGLRLEVTDQGKVRGIPNSRIIQAISQEDSFMDSPDSISVQDVQDDRIVTITIPTGEF